MCQVAQPELCPVDGGSPNPKVYPKACSCSDLIHSVASGAPIPNKDLGALTPFENFTTAKATNYMYV